MLRNLFRISPLALLAIAACTQPPSQIEMKGQNTYGRNGVTTSYPSGNAGSIYGTSYGSASSYQPPAGVYTNTAPVQVAPEQPIGVSDIAPPPASANPVPAPAPVAAAPAAANPAPAPAPAAAPAAVNPWTNRPRFSDNATPPIPPEEPVAQLDHMAGSSVDAKPAAAAPAGKTVEAGFIWPVNSKKVISTFGPKDNGKSNDGINIAAAEGEPVWAAAGGEVVYAGNAIAGYGNMVVLKHKGGKSTAYAHLSRIVVDKYSRVKQGDIIGYVGATGNVQQPQLHFAIRDGKESLDPEKYLD